ncbi:phenylacetaldoxime dehydratase family protein [Erwinia mallotivora]|uniref:phenylacetaldoxime dehydratase family protein n=1 Tax=Erwinia mallotivora TaxID=69222 RepID=UPI0035E50635
MESAIPQHLRVAREHPATLPEDYQPPFPAWTARFTPLTGQVVMACFGVQAGTPLSLADLHPVTTRFAQPDGPLHWDTACCQDAMGFYNLVAIAYWASPQQFDQWQHSSGFHTWWSSPQREEGSCGYFLEVVCPTADRFETIFSDRSSKEGVAHLASGMSDEMQEHGYWGSARDRLPVAQRAELAGSTLPQRRQSQGRRVTLYGRENLCLIRSGQDWSATGQEERRKYLAEVAPVLREGMDFLRDEGATVGCLSCRFMTVLDRVSGAETEKTFGLAHFSDLAALELWARSHPTHVAIFGGFMRYVKELNFNITLRLWHEIVVVPASAQHFSYINCHPHSGLMTHSLGEKQ